VAILCERRVYYHNPHEVVITHYSLTTTIFTSRLTSNFDFGVKSSHNLRAPDVIFVFLRSHFVAINMGKRKLMSPLSSIAQPVVKYKRTCEQPPSANGAKTLTEEEYSKLKLYLKEKKKLLRVSTIKQTSFFYSFKFYKY